VSRPQICHEGGAGRWFIENREPAPLAADDVHERVSDRTEAATQVVRELLNGERGDRLQDFVVRPSIVFEEQMNIVFGHFGVVKPFRRS